MSLLSEAQILGVLWWLSSNLNSLIFCWIKYIFLHYSYLYKIPKWDPISILKLSPGCHSFREEISSVHFIYLTVFYSLGCFKSFLSLNIIKCYKVHFQGLLFFFCLFGFGKEQDFILSASLKCLFLSLGKFTNLIMFGFQVLQFIFLAFTSVLQSGDTDFSSVVGDLKPLSWSSPFRSSGLSSQRSRCYLLDFYNFSSSEVHSEWLLHVCIHAYVFPPFPSSLHFCGQVYQESSGKSFWLS